MGSTPVCLAAASVSVHSTKIALPQSRGVAPLTPLRNLVSALLHHEQIKTTLPKAKEAARMAEKVCAVVRLCRIVATSERSRKRLDSIRSEADADADADAADHHSREEGE
jgi:hypothetical protein